jgi:sugar phosphate isomerase/epimerase
MANFQLAAFTDEYSSDFAKQIEGMQKNGIKYTEIRGVNGKNICHLTTEEVKEAKRMLDANGLATWSVGSPLGKIQLLEDDIYEHLDTCKRIYEAANILETPRIRMFSFFVPDTSNIGQYRSQVMEYLHMMLEAARPYGVTLCHENEKDIYGAKPEGVLEIMKEFKGEIKCIFDPANFIQEDVTTYPDAYEQLKDYIYYMHIKDCHESKWVVPAGTGIGRIPEILADLNKRDETITLTLEPHLCLFDGLKELERETVTSIIPTYKTSEEAFGAATDALKSILANLK